MLFAGLKYFVSEAVTGLWRGRRSTVLSVVTIAAALFVLGRLPEVERPAIATFLPTIAGRMVLIDAGANVDVKPLHVAQFAVMGAAGAASVTACAAGRTPATRPRPAARPAAWAPRCSAPPAPGR